MARSVVSGTLKLPASTSANQAPAPLKIVVSFAIPMVSALSGRTKAAASEEIDADLDILLF